MAAFAIGAPAALSASTSSVEPRAGAPVAVCREVDLRGQIVRRARRPAAAIWGAAVGKKEWIGARLFNSSCPELAPRWVGTSAEFSPHVEEPSEERRLEARFQTLDDLDDMSSEEDSAFMPCCAGCDANGEGILCGLLTARTDLRPSAYFKSTIVALSRAIEDEILALSSKEEEWLVIGKFGSSGNFHLRGRGGLPTAAKLVDSLYLLEGEDIAKPPSEAAATRNGMKYIPYTTGQILPREWFFIVVSPSFTACVVATKRREDTIDLTKRFDGIWSRDPSVCAQAALLALDRLRTFRPDLKEQLDADEARFKLRSRARVTRRSSAAQSKRRERDSTAFAERLVQNMTASNYKLVKLLRVQQQMAKELDRLNQARTNSIKIIAHELRTPLSTIRVCIESAAMEDLSSGVQAAMARTALEDLDRLCKLIDDFFFLDQLERGEVDWLFESVSLQECVEEAVAGLYRRGRDARQPLPKIACSLDLAWPVVRADGQGLHRVLHSLLDNAVKFTPAAGGAVRIASYLRGREVELVVSDNGCGIEPADVDRVFDLYWQEDAYLRRAAGGVGRGLPIARRIVESFGGRIWVESAGRGRGTQVHFTVPLDVERSIHMGIRAAAQAAASLSAPSPRPALPPGPFDEPAAAPAPAPARRPRRSSLDEEEAPAAPRARRGRPPSVPAPAELPVAEGEARPARRGRRKASSTLA